MCLLEEDYETPVKPTANEVLLPEGLVSMKGDQPPGVPRDVPEPAMRWGRSDPLNEGVHGATREERAPPGPSGKRPIAQAAPKSSWGARRGQSMGPEKVKKYENGQQPTNENGDVGPYCAARPPRAALARPAASTPLGR